MTRRTMRPEYGLTFNAKLAILERELTVAAIIVAGILDRRDASEADWARLTLALHRTRALQGEL